MLGVTERYISDRAYLGREIRRIAPAVKRPVAEHKVATRESLPGLHVVERGVSRKCRVNSSICEVLRL